MFDRKLSAVLLIVCGLPTGMLRAADRPNIVWIVSEDNSIHYLNHFFPGGAKAPNIEALAAHGLTFNHAFSNAPVCSRCPHDAGDLLLRSSHRHTVSS